MVDFKPIIDALIEGDESKLTALVREELNQGAAARKI
jgi:hypothetical protein